MSDPACRGLTVKKYADQARKRKKTIFFMTPHIIRPPVNTAVHLSVCVVFCFVTLPVSALILLNWPQMTIWHVKTASAAIPQNSASSSCCSCSCCSRHR